MLGRSRWERNSRGSHRPVAEASCLHRSVHEKSPGQGIQRGCRAISAAWVRSLPLDDRPRLTRIGHSTANNRINNLDLDLDGAASPYSPSSTAGTRRQQPPRHFKGQLQGKRHSWSRCRTVPEFLPPPTAGAIPGAMMHLGEGRELLGRAWGLAPAGRGYETVTRMVSA